MGMFGSKSNHHLNLNNQPKTEEDYFYIDCLELIRECTKMPSMQDTIIPITTERKLSRKEKNAGKKAEETHEIYIAQISPNGINLDGIEFNNSEIIGAIDNDKIFIFTKYLERLEIISVDKYSYEFYGDYYYKSGNILSDGIENEPEQIRITTLSVSNHYGITKKQTTINPSQYMQIQNNIWIRIADYIGRKRKACINKNQEPEINDFEK